MGESLVGSPLWPLTERTEHKRERKRAKVMDKCTQCESDRIFLIDAENEECSCGAVYCADCEAEYSKEGELLAFGLVM